MTVENPLCCICRRAPSDFSIGKANYCNDCYHTPFDLAVREAAAKDREAQTKLAKYRKAQEDKRKKYAGDWNPPKDDND